MFSEARQPLQRLADSEALTFASGLAYRKAARCRRLQSACGEIAAANYWNAAPDCGACQLSGSSLKLSAAILRGSGRKSRKLGGFQHKAPASAFHGDRRLTEPCAIPALQLLIAGTTISNKLLISGFEE